VDILKKIKKLKN